MAKQENIDTNESLQKAYRPTVTQKIAENPSKHPSQCHFASIARQITAEREILMISPSLLYSSAAIRGHHSERLGTDKSVVLCTGASLRKEQRGAMHACKDS